MGKPARSMSAPAKEPARPDYGPGQRNPTMHSIMFGGPNKPRGTPSMEKPPNKPQGPHSDAHVWLDKTMVAAQQKGKLAEIRHAMDPPLGEHMSAALQRRKEERPERMGVFEAHRRARSASLDRHEKVHKAAVAKHAGPDPLPNTPQHLASLQASAELNPYSTTFHLGAKPAAKKYTDGKGEAFKNFDQAYDSMSVNAFTAQRPDLRKEYEHVHDLRRKAVKHYLGDKAVDSPEAPATKKRRR